MHIRYQGKVGQWESIENSLYYQKKVQNWALWTLFTPKRAKLQLHVAHLKNGRTHAHRTRANVRALVRV